jgi:2-polyprenyl-6-methoxyphenol hydroxylase-like FAD-dependent oxidoreductase
MKIAINGAGVAGPALAHWLLRYGHEPVLIEKAPALRKGGYIIDFWGAGYDIAGKMGILPRLLDLGFRWKRSGSSMRMGESPAASRRRSSGA